MTRMPIKAGPKCRLLQVKGWRFILSAMTVYIRAEAADTSNNATKIKYNK